MMKGKPSGRSWRLRTLGALLGSVVLSEVECDGGLARRGPVPTPPAPLHRTEAAPAVTAGGGEIADNQPSGGTVRGL
jgi:hypothetical protein